MGQQLQLAFAEAEPTKEFFISMLTRDIGLLRAIIDLVDNCIDGATRLRAQTPPPADGKDLAGLYVRIEFDATRFKISDNCGGIDIQTAEHYAFRFGRPPSAPGTKHSIGQFGVGMKRALFKLGGHFAVESWTTTHHFKVEQNVQEWTRAQDWKLPFTIAEAEAIPVDKTGTTVVVTHLHESVKAEFTLENFAAKLRTEIEAAHQHSMGRGLAITLNAIALGSKQLELLRSTDLVPGRQTMEFDADTPPAVKVVIIVGVADSDPSAAGWYVYCNGRMIMVADQSGLTGWGEGEGARIPKYHNQFSRFRGFAYFDCDDASKLPWNTTKTGVDADSPIYRSVRQQMLAMMRPVIDFLNKVDNEKDAPDDKPLTEILEAATTTPIATLGQTGDRFVAGKERQAPTGQRPKTRRIAYDAKVRDIEKVQKSLDVGTLKEVGEQTFAYYLRMECD